MASPSASPGLAPRTSAPPPRRLRGLVAVLLLLCSLVGCGTAAEPGGEGRLLLPNLLADGAVLQREPHSARLWGHASRDPGGISVRVGGREVVLVSRAVQARGAGGYEWSVEIEPQEAGGPHDVHINTTGSGSAALSDVLFGDVLLCAGQSNMQMVMLEEAEYEQERHTADYPHIRFISTLRLAEAAVQGGGLLLPLHHSWLGVRPDNVHRCSAVCYYMAKQIHFENPGLPVGLIVATSAGSAIQEFMPEPAISACLHVHSGRTSEGDAPAAGAEGESEARSVHVRDVFGPMSMYAADAMGVALRSSVCAVVWYQGESNIDHPQEYECLLRSLLQHWRGATGLRPFFVVELAAKHFTYPSYSPEVDLFPEIRRVQWELRAAAEQVFVAGAADLGDPDAPRQPIHSRYKRRLAERLVNEARKSLYTTGLPSYQTPEMDAITVTVLRPSELAKVSVQGAGALYSAEWVLASERDDSGARAWIVNVSVAPASTLLELRGTQFCRECCDAAPVELIGGLSEAIEREEALSSWPYFALMASGPGWIAFASLVDTDFNAVGVRYAWRDAPQCLIYEHGENTMPNPVPQFDVRVSGSGEEYSGPGVRVSWRREGPAGQSLRLERDAPRNPILPEPFARGDL